MSDDDDEFELSAKPLTRTNTAASAEADSDDDEKGKVTNTTSQYVCYIHSDSPPGGMKVFALPHPKTGTPSHYALLNGSLFEFQQHAKDYCSWFINDSVEQGGNLYAVTPVDPLFFMLPVVAEKAADKFRSKSDILDGHEALRLLSLSDEVWSLICDVRTVDDDSYFKLNEKRALAWLRAKTRALGKDASLHSRYQGALTLTTEQEKKDFDQIILGVGLGLVSDYITPTWTTKLSDSLKLQAPTKKDGPKRAADSVEAPSPKKPRAGKPAPKPAPKLGVNQRKLQKTDIKGMKTMMSMFGKK
eukprot:NODE_4287_length_1086_cov_60.197300_g4088_i0.p1 GENE.NODE_4287_length_1086_cov_60.197300_g4088_i0~~NODE_4287_length_1086_cov_60.197300_g4088_i0.p1  ORF type:complete len:302 (-),score=59.91 NODE_4287_length_1086_cov_60.197300_g4088_i0:125-1030(-)